MTQSSTSSDRGALVVAVNGDKAVVLTDNGFFLEVPFRGPVPRIGARYRLRAVPDPARVCSAPVPCDILTADRITLLREQPPVNTVAAQNPRVPAKRLTGPHAWRAWVHISLWKRCALGAAVFLLAVMWSLRAALAGPAAVVAIDINPSLNLALDRSGRVLTAEPLNAHASRLLQSASVAGLDLANALTRLLDQAWHLGYLSPGERNVMFIAFVRLRVARNGLAWAPDAAYQAVERSLLRHRAGGTVFVYEAHARLYREASAAGVTVSRYLLIRKALGGDQGSKARTLDLSELLAQVGTTNLFDSNMVLGPVIQRLVPANQDTSSHPYVDPFAHGAGNRHEPAPVTQSRVAPVDRAIYAEEQRQQRGGIGSTASGSNQLQGQTPSPAAYDSVVPPGAASTVTQTAGQLARGVLTELPETSRETTATARTVQQKTPVTEGITGAHWGDSEATSRLITRQTAGVVAIPSVPHEPTGDARNMTGHSGEPALPDTSPDPGNTTRAGETSFLLPPPTQGGGEAKPAVPQPEPVTPPVGLLQPAPAYEVPPIP